MPPIRIRTDIAYFLGLQERGSSLYKKEEILRLFRPRDSWWGYGNRTQFFHDPYSRTNDHFSFSLGLPQRALLLQQGVERAPLS